MSSVLVRLPEALGRALGRREFPVEAATVGQAIAALDALSHGLSDRICDERGLVRKHVLLYVGDTDIRELNGLETPVTPGVTITVVAAVSGG